MMDYLKKKKLLEDNQDIYISENDRALGYKALNDIVNSKRSYNRAKANGDEVGMKNANNAANYTRSMYGNYTAGSDGSKYYPSYSNFGRSEPSYSSRYDDKLDKLYSELDDYTKKFSYKYESDPAYKAYRDVYEKEGDLAYDRALAKNALRTGGVSNTDAQSAAIQAKNYYSSLLASKIPELYKAAYERYMDGADNIYKQIDKLTGREKNDYSMYRDSMEDYKDARSFDYKKQSDYLDREYDRENDERDYFYKLLRDGIEDNRWENEFRLDSAKALLPLTGMYSMPGVDHSTLDYVRRLFGNDSISADDLYRLMGLL